MKGRDRSLRLGLVIVLVLGWIAYSPTASPDIVLADNPREGGGSERYIPQVESAVSVGLLAPVQPAADRTVGSGCTYASIGAALAAATTGDRLLLEGGRTFNEDIILAKRLTLVGGYAGCGSHSSAWTTIDGTGSNTVVAVSVSSPQIVALENLNITGGSDAVGGGVEVTANAGGLTLSNVSIYGNSANFGGGLCVSGNAVVTGTNVIIRDNTAVVYGGGVRLYGGHAVFYDSEIHSNSAPLGAGVYGVYADSVVPKLDLLSYVDVHDNVALTGDGFGGGVYMSRGYVTITDCSDITSNDAIRGGGAYLITTTLTIQGSCSEISYNTAAADGGGIYAQGSTVNLDDGAELYGNEAVDRGGGAYLYDSDLLADMSHITYNSASLWGGGVFVCHNSLLDMDLGGYTCTTPRCSRLSHNTASFGGGGVWSDGTSEVDISETYIEDNEGDVGGGICASGSEVFLTNDIIARNNAAPGLGDGIRLVDGASMTGSQSPSRTTTPEAKPPEPASVSRPPSSRCPTPLSGDTPPASTLLGKPSHVPASREGMWGARTSSSSIRRLWMLPMGTSTSSA